MFALVLKLAKYIIFHMVQIIYYIADIFMVSWVLFIHFLNEWLSEDAVNLSGEKQHEKKRQLSMFLLTREGHNLVHLGL